LIGLVSRIKTETKYEQKSKSRREDFIQKIDKIAPEKLVYLDETGFDDNIVMQYGWSGKGERSYVEQSGFENERLSIVAG